MEISGEEPPGAEFHPPWSNTEDPSVRAGVSHALLHAASINKLRVHHVHGAKKCPSAHSPSLLVLPHVLSKYANNARSPTRLTNPGASAAALVAGAVVLPGAAAFSFCSDASDWPLASAMAGLRRGLASYCPVGLIRKCLANEMALSCPPGAPPTAKNGRDHTHGGAKLCRA